MSTESIAIEFLKCRKSIFYFIYNYCYLPQVGGSLKMDYGTLHEKIIRTIKSVIHAHKAIFMASRQLGKSSSAAMILEYVANFFPGTQIIIINMSKPAAFENLAKIKYIHNHLPPALASPLKYAGDRKSYLEYTNGSVIKTFYYSTTTSPDTLARSLTSSCIYMDESAFTPYISEAFGSAQPVLSKAREQAITNNYPYFILVTSTPNGTVGTGKWFHDMWGNALDSDQIFNKDTSLIDNYSNFLENPTHNSFVKIRYHWSEINSDAWYKEQCRELNFDKRKINQELDLLFVGGTSCVFDDDFLSQLRPCVPAQTVTLDNHTKLHVYDHILDPGDFYIIGVDTAKSLTGDFCCIEIAKYSNMEQVAEYYERVGSTGRFTEDIKQVIQWIHDIVKDNFILGIENNSIGSTVIERLDEDAEFNYTKYLYNSKDDGTLGINTNRSTKPQMVAFLFDTLNSNPQIVHSHNMVDQLSVIERKSNGSVAAQRNSHDDLFMAYAMCAYVRKMSAFDIEPLLNPKTLKKFTQEREKIIHDLTSSINDYGATNSNIPNVFGEQNIDGSKLYKVVENNSNEDEDESMAHIISDLF